MEATNPEGITYKSAGVDIDAGNETVSRIKSHVRSSFQPEVLADIGSFGSMLDLGMVLKGYRNPILIQSIDGVGTKVTIGCKLDRYFGLGVDIVSHACDDILVHGARPVSFLDYVASQKLRPEVVEEIVKGMVSACRECGMSLVGGETAEMPPTYRVGEIDIVGCITGVVEKDELITGAAIRHGDVAVGLASTGLHTNGYSLARKVLLEVAALPLDKPMGELGGLTLGDALLASHKNYYPAFAKTREEKIPLNGMAHITGGGFIDNIPRVLPEGCSVRIQLGSWPVLPVFELIARHGRIVRDELFRTLNMGIGMVWFVNPSHADALIRTVNATDGFHAYRIGEVVPGDRKVILAG